MLDGIDVLHFIGHGSEDSLGFETEVGETHHVNAALLRDLSEGKKLRLVVLNTCHSEGVAQVVRAAGIPAIVAIERIEGIADQAATAFSGGFYAALGRGRSIAQSFNEGKMAVRGSPQLKNARGDQAEHEASKYLLVLDNDESGKTVLIRGADGGYQFTVPFIRHNIPPQGEIFLGREKTMWEVNNALQKERVIVLRGEGGIGKTALARELAAWQAERKHYPGGVAWVDLQAGGTLGGIIDGVGTVAFGQDFRRTQGDRLGMVLSHLSQEASLIILDNFDTVLNDQDILNFLHKVPKPSQVLITCRESVRGWSNKPVEELSNEAAFKLFEYLAAHAGWDGSDRGHIFGICRSVGKHPLAISLIAPQAAEFPIQSLQKRIESGLKSLADNRPDLPERQRGIEACLAVSLDSLSDDARILFSRLGVFAAGATEEAISEVCGMDDSADLTAELVRRGLLRLREQRYSYHPLVRQYALERLEAAGKVDEYFGRMADYFLQQARLAKSMMNTDQALTGVDIARAERENWVAGQQWCYANGDWDGAIDYGHAANAPLDTCGNWVEWILILNKAVEAADQKGDKKEWSRLGHNLGIAYQKQGDYPAARKYYGESLEINRALGDKSGISHSLHMIGILAQDQGEYADARKYYDESLEINRALGDKSGISKSLHQLGRLAQHQGDYAEARKYYDESLEINRAIGDKSGASKSLHELGMLAYLQGDYAEARKYYDESLEIMKALGDKSGVSNGLHELGSVAYLQGDYAEARKYYDESLEIKRALGDKSGVSKSLHMIGILTQDQGDYAEARKHYDESLEIMKALGDKSGASKSLHELGMLAYLQGDYAEARKYYDESLEIMKALGDKSGIATFQYTFALLEEAEGNLPKALELIGQAEKLFAEIGSPLADQAHMDLERLKKMVGKVRWRRQ